MTTELDKLLTRLLLLAVVGIAKLLLSRFPDETTGTKILGTIARLKVLGQNEMTGKDYKEYFEDIDEE
jgi:hypothetical protein